MITLKDYYKGRDVQYKKDLTAQVVANATTLLSTVNKLLDKFGANRGCNSGWRPYTVQMEINPRAPNSKHVTGDAIDIEDADGKLKKWLIANPEVLIALGLYMEDPKSTPTWVHVQQIAPRSGNRVFKP
jgi:hypothetical protein